MKTSFACVHARALHASNAVTCGGTTSTGCMGAVQHDYILLYS